MAVVVGVLGDGGWSLVSYCLRDVVFRDVVVIICCCCQLLFIDRKRKVVTPFVESSNDPEEAHDRSRGPKLLRYRQGHWRSWACARIREGLAAVHGRSLLLLLLLTLLTSPSAVPA
jgi:hypothetical protein